MKYKPKEQEIFLTGFFMGLNRTSQETATMLVKEFDESLPKALKSAQITKEAIVNSKGEIEHFNFWIEVIEIIKQRISTWS